MNYRHLVAAALVLAVAVTGCRHKPKLSEDYEPRDLPPWKIGGSSNNGGSGWTGTGSGNSGDSVTIPRPEVGPGISTQDLDDGSLFDEFPIGGRLGGAGVEEGDRWATVVYFAYNKSFIGEAEVPKLEKLADYMKGKPGLKVVVEGHCDERGSEEYNRALGERRALAIRDYLETLGVSGARIQTISYGEERLAEKGGGEADHALNRRGEFVILGAP